MEDQRNLKHQSSERYSNPDGTDPLVLMIRQIPTDISEEDLTELVSNNGERAVTSLRIVKKPGYQYSFGFANFVSHMDALNALKELNGNPPLNLSLLFARKRENKEKENKISSNNENLSFFKGRGMQTPTNEFVSNVHSNKENAGFTSKGRGQRISLDGPISRIKVCTDSGGRKVTVDTPLQQSEPHCNDDDKNLARDLDSLCKVPNPFYFCFVCGQEGIYSCKYCRKPYCSKNCQTLDFTNHKEICKRAKELAETLLCLYKNFPVQNFDSGVSDSSNSDPEKVEPVIEKNPEIHNKPQLPRVEKIILAPAEVAIVNVINIESLSKFWIRLKKYYQDFLKMEEKLTSLQKDLKFFHSQLCVSPQLYCCTTYNNKMCRAKVLKVKSQNEIFIDLLDYGKSVTVQKSSLCNLPAEFRSLPAQAIACRLVSDDNEIIQWNEEDTLSFELHTSNKTYKTHVFSCSNDVYDVSLINEDGIPLYSILVEEKKAIHTPLSTLKPMTPPILETDGKPISVWSKLKPGAKMFLIPSIVNEDSIWCYLVTGESDLKETMEIEKLLLNYSGEDVVLTVEEGDFAAGFSNEYKQYYRCRILKRMQKSFLVHYIDYGNKEEITQLSSLSEELLQKCCYLVNCEKPSDLSIIEFKKFLGESGAEVTICNVNKNVVQLSFHYKKKYSVNCYLCYSDSLSDNETPVIQSFSVPSKVSPAPKDRVTSQNMNDYQKVHEENKVSSPSSNISPASKTIKPFQNDDYKTIAERITATKFLSPSSNYSVKVLFIKTASELYVQLKDDEVEMIKMINNLNHFCNSKKNNYVPNIGEIVSCKFTDGVWYRGKVLEKLNNDYRVFFVDYGNEDIVSQNSIQLLADRFISPQFSVCVSLSRVKNEDISKSLLSKLLNEEWDMKVVVPNKTPKEVMLFQENVSITKIIENQNYKIKSNLKFQKLPIKSTVKICFEDDKYLYVNQIEDLQSLSEMSVKLNNSSDLPIPKSPKINDVYSGLFVDGLFYRVCIKEQISSDSFKAYFLDFGNFEIVKVCDLRELPDDLFALPVYCIPLQVQDRKELTLNMDGEYSVEVNGTQGNVQLVKFLNLDKSSNSTTKKEANVNESEITAKDKTSLKHKILPEDEIINVKVSFMDNKLVYLQQINDIENIQDLLVQLNSSSLPPAVKPVVNEVYCGLCSDGCWYRVSVEEVTSSNAYKVYFFDFGNYEVLSADKLRELPSDYTSLPIFCIPVIVEKREDLNLNFEEQYKVRVIGKEGNLQKVKFIDYQKDDSSGVLYENKDESEKVKNKAKPDETQNLPHISTLKKQKLLDGSTEVVFCHLEGDIVYCQLSKDCDCVLSMFKSLQKCGREGKVPSSVSIGDVVCAQSSDTLWYRACILCDKKAPSYKVLFFDYGNAEFVTGDCIKILPNDLLIFPVFAIPMKIENADSVTDTSIYTKPMLVRKIKEISGDTYVVELQLEKNVSRPKISDLQRLTLPDNVMSNVTICHADGNLYHVQPTSNIDNLAKLTNQLLEADTFCKVPYTPEENDIICAKFIDNLWYRCAIKKVHSDKIEVTFIDYGNSDSVSVDSIKNIPQELCSYAIASIPIKFKDECSIQSKIQKNITTIDVKVCSVIDNIQVVDIVSHIDIPAHSYTPTFLSAFTKSSLSLNESCKVIFNKKVDDFYFAVKLNDSGEMEKLNSLLQESESDIINHLPSLNEVLLAKRNNLWYRCSVISSFSKENVCKVFFFDVGITDNVEKSEMRNLPDACKTYPLFAIKISVDSDQPVILDKCYNILVLSKNSDDIYSVKVYHQYKYSSINRKELVPMKESDVIFYHKEKEKLFLQNIDDVAILTEIQKILASCSSNSQIPYKPDVGELVCAMSQLDNSWYRGCIEQVVSCDEYKIYFIDYGNCENVQRKHLQPMPFVLTQFPSLSIPVKFMNTEIMEKVELEKIYKVTAESNASSGVQVLRMVENNEITGTTEFQSVSKTASKSDAAKVFEFSSCKFVPFNSGEQDIVIYSVDDDGDMYCAPFNKDNIAANLSLPGLITEHCTSKGIPFDNSQPQDGEMVLALYPVDKNWYRAVVIGNSHPKYDVNFVDYGNSDFLDISSLRKMEEKFMELDIQAHMCSLVGVTFTPENKAKVYSELKKFDVFSYPEPLKANVKITDGDITVNVPVITSHLLQQKLAMTVDEK